MERAPNRQNPYDWYSPPNQTHPHHRTTTTDTTRTNPPVCTLTIDTIVTTRTYNRYNRFATIGQSSRPLQPDSGWWSRGIVSIVLTIPTRVAVPVVSVVPLLHIMVRLCRMRGLGRVYCL